MYHELLTALEEEDLRGFFEGSEDVALEGRDNLHDLPVDNGVPDPEGNYGEGDAQGHKGVPAIIGEVMCPEFQRDSIAGIDIRATVEDKKKQFNNEALVTLFSTSLNRDASLTLRKEETLTLPFEETELWNDVFAAPKERFCDSNSGDE